MALKSICGVRDTNLRGQRRWYIESRTSPLAQSSPSGLTLDCQVLGSKLPVRNFCPTNANGTMKTYNVQNALVNLSLCRINIYIRIFKLELTFTGLTKQYWLTSVLSLSVHQAVHCLHLTHIRWTANVKAVFRTHSRCDQCATNKAIK